MKRSHALRAHNPTINRSLASFEGLTDRNPLVNFAQLPKLGSYRRLMPLQIFRAARRNSPHISWRRLAIALALVTATVTTPRAALAEATILIEADTGKVLHAENATYPWYPASITKLMTTYTILKAVKDGRITLDMTFTVSPIAATQAPTKMGFRPGTLLTVDNALKMMMVRSANDMAVLLAEGLDGSIEKFADEMNANAAKLGMTQTSYVNPNGLPADGQITSARDMAILARAIVRELPDYEYYVHIPAIRFGRRVTRNYNSLIGRYPGADGMKTGFICASGFNLVASATRNGRRLIAVVLGAPSSPVRAAKAAQLLESGFNGNALSWLTPSLGLVDQLQPIAAAPPNLRDDMCGPKRKRPGVEESDDDNVAINLPSAGTSGSGPSFSLFSTASQAATMKPSEMLAMAPANAEPVVVYTGPKREGAALVAAIAADEASQEVKGKGKRGRGAKVAAVKPAAKPDKKPVADKPAAAKPEATPKQADAKPTPPKSVAKPAPDKSATASAKPADKPKTATPKTTAKPDAKTSGASATSGTKLAAKPTDKQKDTPKSQ
jgi:D-alanyl-D-alanine carboxypeptidase